MVSETAEGGGGGGGGDKVTIYDHAKDKAKFPIKSMCLTANCVTSLVVNCANITGSNTQKHSPDFM